MAQTSSCIFLVFAVVTVSVTGGKCGESRTSKAAAEEHCLESSQSLERVGWKNGDLCVPMNLCPATRENSEQIL